MRDAQSRYRAKRRTDESYKAQKRIQQLAYYCVNRDSILERARNRRKVNKPVNLWHAWI